MKTYSVITTDHYYDFTTVADLSQGMGEPIFESETPELAERLLQRFLDENTALGWKFVKVRIKNADVSYRAFSNGKPSLTISIVSGATLDALFESMKNGTFDGRISKLKVRHDD